MLLFVQLIAGVQEMTPLLSSKQLAETLQISEEQVRRLTREGSLPHHRIGGVFRYDLETVKAATRAGGTSND